MEEEELTRASAALRKELRRLRIEHGLTQTELAERLGQPQSYVSKYESGERRLDLPELRNISMAIGTTLTTLVERFEASL